MYLKENEGMLDGSVYEVSFYKKCVSNGVKYRVFDSTGNKGGRNYSMVYADFVLERKKFRFFGNLEMFALVRFGDKRLDLSFVK